MHVVVDVEKHLEECKLVMVLPVMAISEEGDGSFSLQKLKLSLCLTKESTTGFS